MSKPTHWDQAGNWYHGIVGQSGHYYHQHLIIPGSLRLMSLSASASILDLGCGQGVLARTLPAGVFYQGLDSASTLIKKAKQIDHDRNHSYVTADLTKPLLLPKRDFTHAAAILSLQDIARPESVIRFAYQHLVSRGVLLIVLNHPCFRIPRQSGWTEPAGQKPPARWVSSYLSPQKIPITIHPGQSHSPVTWTHHLPLSAYFQILSAHHFTVTRLEEWASDKVSQGKAAGTENRLRQEIPLFMAILAQKN